MKVNIYVKYPGNCADAMAYYEQHLGAKVLAKMTWRQMPGDGSKTPPGMEDKVLHARFTLGDTVVMASDGHRRAEAMRSAYITLIVDSNEEAERIYNALTDGGQVFMAMGETFFAHRFGQFRDKFGANWMVIREKAVR